VTRIFFSAGESSGDMHGANLVRALRALAPDVACEGLGGERMAAAGMALRYDLAGRAIMGFVEVVRSLRFIRRLFHETVARIERNRPDCLVLIDYPGFNVELAKRAHALGIPIVYYISPQVWAWKKRRIHTLARLADKMLVILPFEEALYRDIGVDCTYVGHPLLDQIAATHIEGIFRGDIVIGIMPGSREQEIARLLAPMLDVAKGIRERYPNARFITPCVNAERETQVRALANGFPLETVVGKNYELLAAARFCLVASGTATLEAALFGAPMAVMYRIAPMSYWLARRLVKIEHIALVNILAKRRVVPEFIQHDATTEKILPVALDLIADTPTRATMLDGLAAVRRLLGGPGASQRAAEQVLAVARRGKEI